MIDIGTIKHPEADGPILAKKVVSDVKNNSRANDNSVTTVVAVSPTNKAGVSDGGATKKLVFFGNVARAFDLEDFLRDLTEVLEKGTFGKARWCLR